jgi:hypothetical protein
LDRVAGLRRRKAQATEAEKELPADGERSESECAEQIELLEQRIAHLEAVVEGLQDSVHREAVRTGNQIEALETKTKPGEIARALTRDARKRGI